MHASTAYTLSPRLTRQSTTAQPRLATLLAATIALLAVVASAGGLFWAGLYRDNPLVTAAFRGNDLITLVVAVPGLISALFMARRGSARAELIGMGLLAYMLYRSRGRS